MKRAREESSKANRGEGVPAGSAPNPAPALAPAVAGGGAPAARLSRTIAGSRRKTDNDNNNNNNNKNKKRRGEEEETLLPKSTKSTSIAPASSLAPPPAIRPFSDDSDDKGDAPHEGSSSSSSSSSSSFSSSFSSNSSSGGFTEGGRGGGGETKRAKRAEQTEVVGWRIAANAILEGKTAATGGADQGEKGSSRKKFAVVCSSNVNRSIMAEILLKKNDMRARSFGTGREVKLPGKDSKSPQSFPFGTPYVEIRDFLARQNEALFRRNSVLGLLERDATTKRAPERWQSLESEDVASFDVVVCFESRVFDLVVEDLHQRDPDTFKPLHVVSMTIRDSAEDSAAAAGHVLELCKMLDDCDDLDSDASKLLNGFRSRSKRTVLHQVCHI